jgi:ribose transport system substrate-binding protein
MRKSIGGRNRARLLALAVLVAAAAGVAATVGGSAARSATTASIDAQVKAAQAACRGGYPAVARLYKSAQLRDWLRGRQLVPVAKSPWGAAATSPLRAKAHPKPWTIGFTNSYAGNDARQEVIRSLKENTAKYKKLGLVKDLKITLSNGDVPTHMNQIDQLVRNGADAIMDLSPTASGTQPAIDRATKAGVVFVTMDQPVTAPGAVNVSTANWLQSIESAGWMARELNGKGDVVMIEGIPGETGSEIWEKSAACIFKHFPDIKIVANVPGNWTQSVAKTAMLKVLATHPGNIDGVWIQGPGATGVLQAYQQTGRKLPRLMTNFGEKAVIAFWHDHAKDISMYTATQPPYESTEEAYRVIIRMLSGQRPILNTIYNLGPPIVDETLNQWWKPGYKFPSSYAFAGIAQETWMPSNVLNQYFYNGKAIPGVG